MLCVLLVYTWDRASTTADGSVPPFWGFISLEAVTSPQTFIIYVGAVFLAFIFHVEITCIRFGGYNLAGRTPSS